MEVVEAGQEEVQSGPGQLEKPSVRKEEGNLRVYNDSHGAWERRQNLIFQMRGD